MTGRVGGRLFVLMAGVLLGILPGCNGITFTENPWISGTVTYVDGSPIDAEVVSVIFVPMVGQTADRPPPRPLEAYVGPDGRFLVSAIDDRLGPLPARQRVLVRASGADFQPRPLAIAAQYSDPQNTPLEVQISPDGPNDLRIYVERGQAPTD
jgi:hypothetical protein